MAKTPAEIKLKRALGFWTLTIYGIGDILGAGIYALAGEIAGIARSASWLAFCITLGVASLTALCYAELASRFPKSSGEAQFCFQGFRSPKLALLVGWLVLCSGVVSMATVSHSFAGYVMEMLPRAPAILMNILPVAFLAALAGINFWGIRQSSMVNVVFTAIETCGLLVVIVVGLHFLWGDGSSPGEATARALPHGLPPSAWPSWTHIARAAGLAFFAFIGFEDMVNVAEEVEAPRKNLPAAILTALGVTGFIYIVVIWVATTVVAPADLAGSRAPLLEVVKKAAPAFPPAAFALIALFAVANTALLNSITASRLIYGMSREGLLPASLGRLHNRTQTPHLAVAAVLVASAGLALSGTLVYLAATTNFLILLVFICVNFSLLAVKLRDRDESPEGFRVPLVIPLLGGITAVMMISFLPFESMLRAAILIALGLVIVVLKGKHHVKLANS